MSVLRRVRILVRCLVAFGLIVVLLGGVVAVAVTAGRTQARAAEQLAAAADAMRAAEQVKFRIADLASKQLAWALSPAGDARTMSEQGSKRLALQDASTFMGVELLRITTAQLRGDEMGLANKASADYLDFTDLDGQALKAYAAGTAASTARGNDLIVNEEPKVVAKVGADIDALLVHVSDRVDAQHRQVSVVEGRMQLAVLVLGGAAVALAILAAWGLTRSLTRPLRRLHARLTDIAEGDGDLTRRLDVDGRDEISMVGAAFNRFVDKVSGTVGQAAASACTLAAASEESSATAVQLAAAAQETADQADQVSATADRVSRNVQMVAASVEEMTATIHEIARNATQAARVGSGAVSEAQAANDAIQRLGTSSYEIGEVVQLITSIAAHTHLLALNATIEAARAGEAGRGFAVVASEVKELADSTAKATDQISQRIEAIQGDTGGAIDAVGRIRDVIDQITVFQTTIASAVEQQTATAADMSQHAAEAAGGTAGIASNAAKVAAAAQAMTDGSANSRQAAEDLASMSAELQSLVGQFRY